jgi:polyhydroxyalkanoate synthesis regulator phasin
MKAERDENREMLREVMTEFRGESRDRDERHRRDMDIRDRHAEKHTEALTHLTATVGQLARDVGSLSESVAEIRDFHPKAQNPGRTTQ